jgi:serine O-acetyltransferase
MNFIEYKHYVKCDLMRYEGVATKRKLLKQLIFGASFKYVFWMRTCLWTRSNKFLKWTLFPFARIRLRHYRLQLGIEIPFRSNIGPGFYISHMNGVIVTDLAVIGRDVNLSQCVTIGAANRGKRAGGAIIGDRVYIGPGAKIVGRVTIGNDVAIGANCVVTSDIPDNAVVVGIPGKVISSKGSEGYIQNASL